MSHNSNGRSVWQRWFSAGSTFSLGNALHLNGANSRVDFTTVSPFSGANKQTGAMWVKGDAVLATTQRVIWATNSAYNKGWGVTMWKNGANPSFGVIAANGGVSLASWIMSGITYTDWNHYGWVYDGVLSGNTNRLKLYVNGIQITVSQYFATVPATIGASGNAMRLGSDSHAAQNFFDGWLDEPAIWTDADATHITNHYNAGSGATPDATNIYRYYPCNESNPATTLVDDTATENGTLVNFNYDANDGFGAH